MKEKKFFLCGRELLKILNGKSPIFHVSQKVIQSLII